MIANINRYIPNIFNEFNLGILFNKLSVRRMKFQVMDEEKFKQQTAQKVNNRDARFGPKVNQIST